MGDLEALSKNFAMARELWQRAAEKNDNMASIAQIKLGLMYADGLGVKQNYDQAIDWFAKASARGDMNAKLLLVACIEKKESTTNTPSIPYEFTKLFNSYGMQELKKEAPAIAERLAEHVQSYKTLDTNNRTLELINQPFDAKIAEKFLAILFSNDVIMPIQSMKELKGPGGHIYISLFFDADKHKNNNGVVKNAPALDGLLKEEKGLALFKISDMQNPICYFSYGDMLCYKIFKSLRPQRGLDGLFHRDILSKPVPAGTKARLSRPSENIFPKYARDVVGVEIEWLLGRTVNWHFELIEYPSIDSLIRFVIKIEGMEQIDQSIGKALLWYLPYPFFG